MSYWKQPKKDLLLALCINRHFLTFMPLFFFLLLHSGPWQPQSQMHIHYIENTVQDKNRRNAYRFWKTMKVNKWQKWHFLVGEREILPPGLRWAKASHKDAAVPHLRFSGLKRHPCCNLQVSAGLSALRVLCETQRYRWRQDKKRTHWGGGLIKDRQRLSGTWKRRVTWWINATSCCTQNKTRDPVCHLRSTRYSHAHTHTHGSCVHLNTEHF